MKHTVYVKLSQITELTHKDVVLKDVAQVYPKMQTEAGISHSNMHLIQRWQSGDISL